MRLLPLALLSAVPLCAACDWKTYRPIAGVQASAEGEGVAITWTGERNEMLRLRLGVEEGQPVVRELAVRAAGRAWARLGSSLTPVFGSVSGVRRTAHGLPDELRWYAFWDAPLSVPGSGDQPGLPRKPEEIQRSTARFASTGCEVRSEGARVEVTFDGAEMPPFRGGLRYTVYRGSNLLRQELVAKTDQPSVAYIYSGGVGGLAVSDLSAMVWRDGAGNTQRFGLGGEPDRDPVVLRARNRLAIAEERDGSIGVFPPPHQFFFAREIETNPGYLWYRKSGANKYEIGVRQSENAEGYNPVWRQRVWALYNAPPGTEQHMPVYFYLSAGNAAQTREAVLAYTHGDRYQPLAGYQVMATHFHTAFTKELEDSGSLDTLPQWIPAMRALGINIAHIFDFHGDGHPSDTGEVRLKELDDYFAACRRHSDRNFLIVPGEEANAYFGGHYNILFPHPVYWTHRRAAGQQFSEQDPRRGSVFHVANAEDLFELMKREGAVVWQTHPRTKGSTGFPDEIRAKEYFRSPQWLGAAFKALPVDLSQKRLCEARCFGTLDDINNWAGPKYMVGEVDTYKKYSDYDLYGDFNVNYVKLDRLPPAADWSPLVSALRAGEFFVTTGEVLIRNFRAGPDKVSAEVEWTFPLEFAEAVWGDGRQTGRMLAPGQSYGPFGRSRIEIPVQLKGKRWVRFAVWDSAGNGAFTQPLWLAGGA